MALHFSYVDCDGNAYYIAYPIGHKCTGIPAWSLHRIISMVYSSRTKKNVLGLAIIEYENPFEDMIRQIEWLIKEGYFNKDYLQEQAGSSREG